MSDSIQITPSGNTGEPQAKLSSSGSAENTVAGDDPAGFTAVFASYTEAEPAVTEQHIDENLTDLLNQLLPQEVVTDGNSLPAQDEAVMWQALMLLQPAENSLTNSSSNQLQSIGLFENQRKPALNSSMLNQDYFNTLSMQAKEPGTSIPAGLAANNITAQLAAAHFMPESSESVLLNLMSS